MPAGNRGFRSLDFRYKDLQWFKKCLDRVE